MRHCIGCEKPFDPKDSIGATDKGKRQVGLENEVKIWPTPERSQSLPQDPPIRDGQQSCETAHGSRRRLNPAFAAWLMGFPFWWTHPEPILSARSATASWLSRARRLLESF